MCSLSTAQSNFGNAVILKSPSETLPIGHRREEVRNLNTCSTHFPIALSYSEQSAAVLSRTLSVITLIAQLEDVISLSKVSLRKQSKKGEGGVNRAP